MAILKTEASAFGKSVVAIARNEIFELVDELLVLKAGWTMNCARVGRAAVYRADRLD